jgi:hypothetical protein
MADNQHWTRRPPGSTWGDWGPDDERGRLNLLTPEKVLQGVAEVKTGKTFCLSLPLDYPGGAILPVTPPTEAHRERCPSWPVCPTGDTGTR